MKIRSIALVLLAASSRLLAQDTGTVSCSPLRSGARVEWTFDLKILIQRFQVLQDGFEVASPPPEARSVDLRLFDLAIHRFEVFAVPASGDPLPVGSCTLDVECVGLLHEVSHLTVHLHWEPPAGDPTATLPPPPFVVTRDGELVASTEATEVDDDVPAPGKYLYQVTNDPGGTKRPTILIGTCNVEVAGDGLASPTDLVCALQEKANPDTADLSWKNGEPYDRIEIHWNGSTVETLAGDATQYRFTGIKPGSNRLAVQGFQGDRRSGTARCEIDIEPSVLYFSTSPSPRGDPSTTVPSRRLTCLLDNRTPIQGWAFGVRSDSVLMIPVAYELGGTVTDDLNGGKGPGFLKIDLLGEGFRMEVAIDPGDPARILHPGTALALITVEYDPGVAAEPGISYPVDYDATIGEPPVGLSLTADGTRVAPNTLPGLVAPLGVRFIRTDANRDGAGDLSDALTVLNWLFLGQEKPGCFDAADADDNGTIDITDAIYILTFLFLGGTPPPEPYPGCGEAREPLGCDGPDLCR